MNVKKLITTVAVCTTLAATAAVKIGEVGNDFANSLAYAEANSVPIVVTWGNTSCGYCNTLAKTVATDEVTAWIAEHKILFVEKHEDYGSKDEDYVAAGKWVKGLGAVSGYPFMGVYWKKADGTVEVSTAFTARKNQMPVSTPKNDFAGQIVGTLDLYLGDYEGGDTPTPTPSESGDASFVTGDTDDDHLEVTADTETVYVPLVRETSDKAAGNTIEARYPDGSTKTVSVSWKAGVDETYAAIDMPTTFAKGKQITLTLKDASGTKLDTSYISLVAEAANSPTNPHWIGEYDASGLPYGEWTMDYETAKAKLAGKGGYIIACFSGVKWCPHCIGIDDSLFADKKFYSWAKKNKVILVLFDQPRWNSTDGCQYEGPRLLSYNNDFGKSGASYLSRKGLRGDDKDVLAAIDRQWTLTRKWLAPESTASRLSNPTVLLLDSTGTKVAARMNKYELEDRTFPTAENLNRLNDLLLLVDADEKEGYQTVSPLEIAAGSSEKTALQVNDKTKFYALTGVKAGKYLKVSLSTSDKNPPDTALTLYAGDEVLASGTTRLVTDHALTDEEVADLHVKVSSFSEAAAYGAKTTFAVALTVEAGSEELVKTVDMASLSKSEQKALNPTLYSKRSATVPIFKPFGNEGKCLVGTLAISVTSANKISAKYAGVESVAFSGTWDTISLMTGNVSTELAKSGVILSLEMDAEGGFSAALTSNGPIWGSGECSAGNLSDYVGSYTVTLVDAAGEAGTGYLTVKATKQGKATVAGVMPDGVTVSASTVLAPNADGTATLAIYKELSKGTLSVALAIDANAAASWGDEGNMDTVRALPGCLCWWSSTALDEIRFNIYGGYWKAGTTPLEICETFDLSDTLAVVVGGKTNDTVTATKSGFKVTKDFLTALSFAKATGSFSGKAKVVNSSGKAVTATVKGVLLPGWIDCGCTTETVVERPYGSGTLYYTDGKTTVSIPIDLIAKPADAI